MDLSSTLQFDHGIDIEVVQVNVFSTNIQFSYSIQFE